MERVIPSPYEWAGGFEAIQDLFKAFYTRVPLDPVLGPVFAGMPAEHFETVAHFVSEVLGGPKSYTAEGHHSHSTMVAKHLNRHLTQEQRQRWMALLLETADRQGLPDDPEFRSVLVGYLEWGSRIAVLNSTATDNPIDPKAPMPTWGWGEVKGPYVPSSSG
jgi:hemoglobin